MSGVSALAVLVGILAVCMLSVAAVAALTTLRGHPVAWAWGCAVLTVGVLEVGLGWALAWAIKAWLSRR